MRTKTLTRWLILMAICAPRSVWAAPPVSYRIALDISGKAPELAVSMSFRGDASGETTIDLPTKWAGTDALYRNLIGLTLDGGALLPGADPAHRLARHRPNARMTLHYHVVDNRSKAPDADDEKANPILQKDWIYVHTNGAIAEPHGREAAPARFSLAAPPGWRIVSDLEHPERGRLTVNDIGGAIIVGGRDLRLVERPVGISRLRLAVVGRWAFADARLADNIALLMATENKMLSATAVDYLVTLGPLTGSKTGAMSYGGTGRTAGFDLLGTDNISLEEFTRVLAHEYGHRWFGRHFGPSIDGAHDYLFTEGFNDWFAGVAMVRSGLWTVDQWTASLNALLLRYQLSGARGLAEAELTKRFWTDQDAQQLPYDRGHLTALLFDARSHALLSLLRTMAKVPAREESEPIRFERLAAVRAPDVLVQARAEAGGWLLAKNTLAACGTLLTVTQPIYARGFAMDDASRRVTSVVPGSPADKAGIRGGMHFDRRVSNEPGDSSVPYVAEFSDAAGVRRASWLPEGPTMVTFQRLQPDRPVGDACRTLVAGEGTLP